MPLYEFVCQDCDHAQELLLQCSAEPVCEKCGSGSLTKLLSLPVAHGSAKNAAADQCAAGPSGPPAGGCGAGCGCFHG